VQNPLENSEEPIHASRTPKRTYSLAQETLQQQIQARAARHRRRILLPEAAVEPRMLHAARNVSQVGFAEVVLVGNRSGIANLARSEAIDVNSLPWIDPAENRELLSEVAAAYMQRRTKDNLDHAQAEAIVGDPLYFAAMLVSMGRADGMVAGAYSTTADVLRASIRCIGTEPGIHTVSSNFIISVPDHAFGKAGVMMFADCAVMIEPNVQQLADIAISTAESARALLDMEPRVAMLSFSTHGSAQHPKVNLMREAAKLVNELRPDIPCDGELQGDAALIESVAKRKAPGSEIAGAANILIFPNLDAGNICYKLVQRLGRADAMGPILQGLAKPVNDLSRGCSIKDIEDVIAITAAKANIST
jgi:phosphate acetyltransferase